MNPSENLLIIDKKVLPEVFTKVIEAKKLLNIGKAKTVQEAAAIVGISRSAFYKYRDSVFPLYEHSRGKTVTFAFNIMDLPGILSMVLNQIAECGANILTINQNIPINGMANVTITVETGKMTAELGELMDLLMKIEGVQNYKIIARE